VIGLKYPRQPIYPLSQSNRIPDNDIINYVRGKMSLYHLLNYNLMVADDPAFLLAARDGKIKDISSSVGFPDVMSYLTSQPPSKQEIDDYVRSMVRQDNGLGLIIAAAAGHLPFVQYLISQGANVSAQHDRPLILAAIMGHLPVVQYLIDHGANPHAQNDRALIEGTPVIQRYLEDVIAQERQMRSRYRQSMQELQVYPPSGYFPGGVEYQQAQERYSQRH
jgi:hypothetical protein